MIKLTYILPFLFFSVLTFSPNLTTAEISENKIKIGLLTDMSGPYSDITGQGAVEAVKLAITDYGGKINGKNIELFVADHLNKADVGYVKVREWLDRDGIDIVLGGGNSSVILAISDYINEKKKPFLIPATATGKITNESCSYFTIHYCYDTVSAAKGTSSAVIKQGGEKWYFLTADYIFGTSLQKDASEVIYSLGGEILGSSKHPLNSSDFSSYLLKATSSKAQILGLANASNDLINSIKAANEFGVSKNMQIAALLMFITDVHSLGLHTTKGLYTTTSWYWDQNGASRSWSKRFFKVMKKMPTAIHASTYSATMNYLNSVKTLNSDDGEKVIKFIKQREVNDMYTKNARIREDGRLMSDLKLVKVKSPSRSKYSWDYYEIIREIPAEEAFISKFKSKCRLLINKNN